MRIGNFNKPAFGCKTVNGFVTRCAPFKETLQLFAANGANPKQAACHIDFCTKGLHPHEETVANFCKKVSQFSSEEMRKTVQHINQNYKKV